MIIDLSGNQVVIIILMH